MSENLIPFLPANPLGFLLFNFTKQTFFNQARMRQSEFCHKQRIIMSEEHTSIHEFDFELICEYFAGPERQGPGSPETTVKAIGFLYHLTDQSRIADFGCGTGGQTMILAVHVPGIITGIDLFPKFIELFNQQSEERGFQKRVRGVVASMEGLLFAFEELDLIWSEGAKYNIGFERSVQERRKFLKPGGFLAVTEASWFTV